MKEIELHHIMKSKTPKNIAPGETIILGNLKADPIIRKNRGQILSGSIIIEEDLEKILERLLQSELYDSKKFGKKFWRKINITFNVKIHMLSSLIQSHSIIKKNKELWKDYEKMLFKINDIRNLFAHGRIFYIQGEAFISYIQGKRIKTKKLDDTYWQEIEDILNKSHSRSYLIITHHLKK